MSHPQANPMKVKLPAATPPTRRVFLSSTSVDLHPWRSRIDQLLPHVGQFSVVMDRFALRPLGTEDAVSLSLDELGGCDVYILLLGWRYGYIPAGQTLSVTHQEYRKARELGLTCYAFLADPSTEPMDSADSLFPARVRDVEHRTHLLAFRTEVAREPVCFFTTPDDLVNKVIAAITRYLLSELWHECGASEASPRHLPPRAVGFVGRAAELASVTQALLSGQHTGLTALISGMGGVGKSALAAEICHRLASDPTAFPAGIGWVRCDGRTGRDGLASVYRQLLSLWGAPLDHEAPTQTVASDADLDYLEQRLQRLFRDFLSPGTSTPETTGASGTGGVPPVPTALVLLDNVEVAFPLTRALDILAVAGVTTLVTARQRPATGRLRVVTLDVLAPDSAVALFAERYIDKEGDWQPTRDRRAAKRVVKQLGYLPLAIELAAARAALTHTSVAGLTAELDDARRMGYLEDPLHAGQRRDKQSSVRYTLTCSLETLTPTQRLRFGALGWLKGAVWSRALIEPFLGAVVSELAPDNESPNSTGSAAADLDLLVALSLVTLSAPSTLSTQPAVAAGDTLSTPTLALTPHVRVHPLLHDLAREEWHRLMADTSGAQEAATLALSTALDCFFGHYQSQHAVLDYVADRAIAERVLARLPAKYAVCLLLYEHEGFSCAEIAEVLKFSPSAVKMRLMRARERFITLYKQEVVAAQAEDGGER